MRRLAYPALALLLAAPAFLAARPAFAHGFGQRYDLPVPLWLYLYGAVAAVLLSFILVGFFVGRDGAPLRYPRFDLLRPGLFRTLLASRPVISGLRWLSVGLFLVMVMSGLLGTQTPPNNFAPTFVWIVWWVGFSFLTAFVGNFWALLNPWKVTFEWADGLARRLRRGNGLELHEPYPAGWGVWPAMLLFFCFIWVELVFQGSPAPLNIAVFTLLYSVITWTCMAFFGKDEWLRRGEAFSVYFGILARFAPTEARVREPEVCRECGAGCRTGEGDCVNCYECFSRAAPGERELNLRPPAVGLGLPGRSSPGLWVFVVFVLSSVAFDDLSEIPLWVELQEATSIPQTLGLFGLLAVFLVLYLVFVKVSQIIGGSDLDLLRLAAAYSYSLVPIAIGYQVAHYHPLLLIQGQAIFALISDPFGLGWDLFGTAGYQINIGLIGAAFVWYAQVLLVVGGHVVAVYLSHLIALRSMPAPKQALRSQYPMLALMLLYTVFSLWLLSQPIA